MKKISIIIVNWNGKDFLANCLNSLDKISYPNYEIIIVDNNSSDDSVEFIKSNYSDVLIIRNDKNIGFAKANNIGFQKSSGDYILFLNNDTKVRKDFLDKLVTAIESNPGIGGVQSKILSLDRPDLLDSVGAYLTGTGFLYHFGYLQKDSKEYDKVSYLYTAKGACMMFKREVIGQVGLFDSDFFAYFEETDFCHRVWLAGYKIRYVPDSVVFHKIGGTSNKMDSGFIQFNSFKNRIRSYLKNCGPELLLSILPLHILLCLIIGAGFLLKGKVRVGILVWMSILWNLIYFPSTLVLRNNIQQKIRKVKDSDIEQYILKNPKWLYFWYLFNNNIENYKQ